MPLDEAVVAEIYREHGPVLRRFVGRTSLDPGISSRFARATAACSSAQARPRRPWTSRASPVSIRPA